MAHDGSAGGGVQDRGTGLRRCPASGRHRGTASGRHVIDAAGGPGMTAREAADGEPGSAQRTVPLQGDQRVLRTARVVPAARRRPGGDGELVEADESPEDLTGKGTEVHAGVPHRRTAVRRAEPRSSRSCSNVAAAAAGLARTTTRPPSGTVSSASITRPRNLRRTRFRTTAPPTARDTTNPTCRPGSSPVRQWTTRVVRPARAPRRIVSENSADVRIRTADGSNSGGELRPPLAPTGGKDRAAGAGPHTQTEAVGLGPAPVVRLEGALRHVVLHRLFRSPPVGGSRRPRDSRTRPDRGRAGRSRQGRLCNGTRRPRPGQTTGTPDGPCRAAGDHIRHAQKPNPL